MIRSLIVFSLLVFLVGCGNDSPGSSGTDSTEVTVDAFNVALAGAFIPYAVP